MKRKFYAPLLMVVLVIAGALGKPANAQTSCTSNNPLLCASVTPDLSAYFNGPNVSSLGLLFTATASSSPATLTLTSRLYTQQSTDGCVLLSFTQAGSATISSTDIIITTNTGLTLSCTNVTVGPLGAVCVRICDPALTQGTLFRVGIRASVSLSGTVQVSNFAI